MVKAILSSYCHTSNLDSVASQFQQELHDKPTLVLFFASTTYDFASLSHLLHEMFPQSEVIGVTTVGEISATGFQSNGVVAMSFNQQFQAKAVLVDDIERFPIYSRKHLIEAANSLNISLHSPHPEKEGLGLIFPNGLVAGEEKMLSIVNSLFEHEGFPIFGGTAGDDAKFTETFVSVNGVVSSKGGAFVFIKTSLDFMIQKENIFRPTGKVMEMTRVNTEERIVYEMNNKRAASEYARLLGISEQQLPSYFMKNPLGRTVNGQVYIASPFQVLKDGSIQFYCQIFQHQKVAMLEPKDPVSTLQESIAQLTASFHTIEGVLAINCILRKLQFEQEKLIPALNQQLAALPSLAGFSSYGEQLNKTQLNQTLVMLSFGKK
ncbi:FIST signal transduction protein [Bacillus sp. Hm123]|uniref:FIST signal transduction protein n=1 Tax=Bacillus sp. Hm123 TaxID=3450745 RepID=UPI003F41CEC7